MQNFSNSPAPPSLPPGFGGRNVGGPSYPPQPTEPQMSPRIMDEYVGMQQQSIHRGQPHPGQPSHLLGYNARSRGVVEPNPTQGNIHSGNNPYRKDAIDYYFSMGAKDRHRRGGMSYGGGFGYASIDGHISHQYRHPVASPAPSPGLMSPYPMDYGANAGSSGAVGAFSPSHQYNMNQNPAVQPVPGAPIQHRPHGQNFPPVHLGQQHRNFPQSGHRMTPQYSQYTPQTGTSAGSPGMYSPPLQRYLDGAANSGFDPKVNSSPSVNSGLNPASNSVAVNNVGPETVQQSYHAPNYPGYASHSLHKQAALQHRNSQHATFDPSLKMQHQGLSPSSAYAKHQQGSNASLAQPASQELAKSPLNANAQQNQINQNFSPISNPSPAASALHSPSCSSSPSPLMSISEAHGNAPPHASSHPPMSNPRNSHSHGRLLQTMPQLSPTPNSNSSISSSGSCGSRKANSINSVAGSSIPPTSRSKMGQGAGIRPQEEYSASSLDKLQDAGLNSLNALSSQVANLPNTVQHMLLTDTVLSQKKREVQIQQATHGSFHLQPRSRNASAASSVSTAKDGSVAGTSDGTILDVGADEDSSLASAGGSLGTKMDQEEPFSEGDHGRVRQISGASSSSETMSYNQIQTGLPSNVKTPSSSSKEAVLTETKLNEDNIPTSTSPSSRCASENAQILQPINTLSSSPSSTPSSDCPPHPKSVAQSGLACSNNNSSSDGEIKKENEAPLEKTQVSSHMQQDDKANFHSGQDKENRLHSSFLPHHNNKKEKDSSEEKQITSNVGVIVSARSEGSHVEKSQQHEDNCEEEKPETYLGETSSLNGEEGMDLSMYSAHQKLNNDKSQNLPQFSSGKYPYPDLTHGSDLPTKSRTRLGPTSGLDSNPRYLGYQRSHGSFGPVDPKQPNSASEGIVKRGQGAGPKDQDANSHMQPFQSLLQEVLQGYNLDRRYGRAEQAFPAHHFSQQQFLSRHLFDMNEGIQMPSEQTEDSGHCVGMNNMGKLTNRKDTSEGNFSMDTLFPVKSEVSEIKIPQKTEKIEVSVSQSPLTQENQPTPTKHINLADYSLPQKKGLANFPTPPSAVQELLLQEPEPLTGTIGQAEVRKSSGSALAPSERRSVICDVSPNRRSTPEKDREGGREWDREKNQSGASVIQQQFSSSATASEPSVKDLKEKQVGKKDMTSKDSAKNAVNMQTAHHSSVGGCEADMDYMSKSVHSSGDITFDPYRRGGVHANPIPPHPLSSPTRHQTYLHGVDLSAGAGSTFPGFRYGDNREGNMRSRGSTHFPSHHPYQHLQPPSQAANKLHIYPHHRGLPHLAHEMSDWVKAVNRSSKEGMMMQQRSSPGRHKGSQLEQRQQVTEATGEHLTSNPSLHQSSYYDIKMWESTHTVRDAAHVMEGDPYYRVQAPPTHPPPPSSAPRVQHGSVPPKVSHSRNAAEPEVFKGSTEEAKHPCPPPLGSTMPRTDTNTSKPQAPRPTKGGSGDTNPLILRRRVRSFISPIPAKRQFQDMSQQRAAVNSNHSPGVQTDTRNHQENDSSGADISCPRLSLPTAGESASSQPLSPSCGGTKTPPSRKGRGLKLEAIVQKITPNVKKPAGHAIDEANQYTGFSQSEMSTFSESQEQELEHFTRVTRGDDGYMEESQSLQEMIPFRGVDDTLPPPVYPREPNQAAPVIKQQDFDFGLGGAVASASGDKEDFALLGPLPPPPPLPRPVQASSPPSSSALSDIQHFTNTYQQLETRRGEQSAANLLRQKLQESGMGFEDYSGSDFYGSTPPQQGHALNRQHQMSSQRSSLSPQDSKPLENVVPKGYFPSGKKKGRPVGSVNKQKRAQGQVQGQAQIQTQSTVPSTSPGPPIVTATADTVPPVAQTASSTVTPTVPALPERKSTPPPEPPVLTQVVKADVESEETQAEPEVKLVRRRRRGVKDNNLEVRGQQRRRRRVPVASTSSQVNEDPEEAAEAAGTKVFSDANKKGPFSPHIHVEKKVPEIGAVCTIINAEEDKAKGERSVGGTKASGSGIDFLLTSALCSQSSRRDRETEKRDAEEVETTLQTGKALPSSGYVVSGQVITESHHSGRLLCCLCQKWANYKHLGDLYGPYYPAEYAAKLPKNQPQVRQGQAIAGTCRTGPNSDASTSASVHQDTKPPSADINLDSKMMLLTPSAGTASQIGVEEMLCEASRYFNPNPSFSSPPSVKATLSWDSSADTLHIPELKREPDVDLDHHESQKQPLPPTEEAQQRGQHRKLTSHPRFKRRHKSREDSPRMVPSNSKASLPFQPPPPALDSLGPLAQLAQLPQMPMDSEELWVHEGCIVWTSGVYLVNGRLYGLQEALDGARETSCSFCEMVGSTLGCYTKGCTLRYHYLCAIEADCSLNEDNFSLRCPKHKVKKESFPKASGQSSQCTWSSRREADECTVKEEAHEFGACYFGR